MITYITRALAVEHISHAHIAQSIDLLSVHGFNFVNLRDNNGKLCCLVVPVTHETALSAPRPSPDQEDMNFSVPIIFCCDNSIAI